MARERKKVLLRGSWQTKNIGDIAHTPGFLNLAAQFMPETEIQLWPCQLDRGVREMLLANFHDLKIVESDAEIQSAFSECDLLINGSGPCVDFEGIRRWRGATQKPYGFFGISADGLWNEERRTVFSDASFIFCRDSLSVHFLKQQGLKCSRIAFVPDSTFGLKLEKTDDAADFLRENGLEPDRFVCVIPRLRFTPAAFDEEHFFYNDPAKEAASMSALESDMAKMRDIICHIVDHLGLKVLICPEMTYQVPMGRRYLYEKLPPAVRDKVVLKREYWITSEAESVYAGAAALVSMEMHSPIIFIAENKPAVLLRQAEDTWKGQMWRDIGLQDWIFELDISSAGQVNRQLDTILKNYPASLEQAATAHRYAVDRDRTGMEEIAGLLNAEIPNEE